MLANAGSCGFSMVFVMVAVLACCDPAAAESNVKNANPPRRQTEGEPAVKRYESLLKSCQTFDEIRHIGKSVSPRESWFDGRKLYALTREQNYKQFGRFRGNCYASVVMQNFFGQPATKFAGRVEAVEAGGLFLSYAVERNSLTAHFVGVRPPQPRKIVLPITFADGYDTPTTELEQLTPTPRFRTIALMTLNGWVQQSRGDGSSGFRWLDALLVEDSAQVEELERTIRQDLPKLEAARAQAKLDAADRKARAMSLEEDAVAKAMSSAASNRYRCPEGMTFIDGGVFEFGSPDSDELKNFGDLDASSVRVGDFCIYTYEAPSKKAALPTREVTWRQAAASCRTLGYRLCSEVEWERACKGLANRRFPYGRKFDADSCNTEDAAGAVRPLAPSGAFSRCVSASGVADLSGNVAEWTGTAFEGDDHKYIVKGGDAESADIKARCSARAHSSASASRALLGFRCCTGPIGPPTMPVEPRQAERQPEGKQVATPSLNPATGGWLRFVSAPLGIELEVPGELSELQNDPTGAGSMITSPDGLAAVYVAAHEPGTSLEDAFDEAKRPQRQMPRRVTYSSMKAGWYVVSGYERDDESRIFYEKGVSTSAGIVFASFSFPTAERKRFDPALRRFADAVKAWP